MLNIEIQGTKQAIQKINEIEAFTKSQDIKKYLAEKIISVINRISEERLSYNENYINHNKYKILDEGILVYNDVQNDSGEYYSLILEYGSGLYAEKDHIGTTEAFQASGYMYWYVPEEEAPELFDYPYERIVTEDGAVLYKVYGQTPKHIYEDAADIVERNVARWIREYITEKLGGK